MDIFEPRDAVLLAMVVCLYAWLWFRAIQHRRELAAHLPPDSSEGPGAERATRTRRLERDVRPRSVR